MPITLRSCCQKWMLRAMLFLLVVSGADTVGYYDRGETEWFGDSLFLQKRSIELVSHCFFVSKDRKGGTFQNGTGNIIHKIFLPEVDGWGYGLLYKPAEWYRVSFAERVE